LVASIGAKSRADAASLRQADGRQARRQKAVAAWARSKSIQADGLAGGNERISVLDGLRRRELKVQDD